jgi:hypothetical protein
LQRGDHLIDTRAHGRTGIIGDHEAGSLGHQATSSA